MVCDSSFEFHAVEVHGGFAGVLDAVVGAVGGGPVGTFWGCGLADYFAGGVADGAL